MTIDEAIEEILLSWDDWEAEAGQEAQIHQDGGAHVDHMRQRLKGVIGLVAVSDQPIVEKHGKVDAPQPWYMNPTAEESLAWIRQKISVPEDARMFSGDKTIAGQLHVICSHADGYMKYITSYKCNDKQGEIARQSVRIAELEAELKRRCQCRWDEVDGNRIHVSECHLHQCERSVLLDNGDPSPVTKDQRIAELEAEVKRLTPRPREPILPCYFCGRGLDDLQRFMDARICCACWNKGMRIKASQ